MPWLRRVELPSSGPALRPHCLSPLRLRLRQVRRRLLLFELNLRTQCNIDGGVHVPASDEVALRTPSPCTPCNHENARMKDAHLRAVHQAQTRRQRFISFLVQQLHILGVIHSFVRHTGQRFAFCIRLPFPFLGALPFQLLCSEKSPNAIIMSLLNAATKRSSSSSSSHWVSRC